MSEVYDLRFEENGQYAIDVYKQFNHLRFIFFGPLKKAEDIPNYVEHVKQAVKEVNPGFTVLSHAVTKKNPGFSTTASFKEGMNIMAEAGASRISFFSLKKSIIHEMVNKVLVKLSKVPINILDDLTKAEEWLKLTNEQRESIAAAPIPA